MLALRNRLESDGAHREPRRLPAHFVFPVKPLIPPACRPDWDPHGENAGAIHDVLPPSMGVQETKAALFRSSGRDRRSGWAMARGICTNGGGFAGRKDEFILRARGRWQRRGMRCVRRC